MINLSIVFFGTPKFSVTILEALAKSNFAVKGVVTGPDAVSGRRHDKLPSPVKKWAIENNRPTFTPDKLKDNQPLIDHLRSLHADIFIVASYGKIIPQRILDIPKLGAVNWHPSLLPKYRGPSPVPQQILDGVTKTGVSLIQMNAAMDAGPILAQQSVPIPSDATCAKLIMELADLGAEMLVDLLPKLTDGSVRPKSQDDTQATYTKILTKQDGFISSADFTSVNPTDLDRKIRALVPWPGVWTTWQNKTIKFLPGKMVQVEGKNPISYKQFLNGYPDAISWGQTIFENTI